MFGNMMLRQKLMLGASFLAIIPIVIASLALGWTAVDDAHDAMAERAEAQLVSLREVKRTQISDYFDNIRNQVLTLSNDRMIIEFAIALPEAYNNFPSEFAGGEDTQRLRSNLGDYYNQQFTPEFNRLNSGVTSPASSWLSRLDKEGVALQYQYIQANPNALGSKNGMSDPKDGTGYSRLHALYHPHINDFLEKFGYYDIFIVDPKSGDVVYSVYKELDFATSLTSGPFASTGLGKAYQAVVNSSFADAVAIEDFATYGPSYNNVASFVASPIYDGGKLVGVLVFQTPIAKINEVMTSARRWAEVGLGASGETYLVGPDRKMRNDSRFLIDDKTGYLQALTDAGTSRDVLESISAKDTSIGLAQVSSSSALNALAGQSGFQIIPDYRGVPVLSAYGPVDI
ncbi:MAG: methyl-accepting chemotaxis protein, partial [Gammaproteobacteria bacterium]|nr:methyl-accepting chemotaxis protein [Gammaproteobacteria bacterium]